MNTTKDLNNFDIYGGFHLRGSYIQLDENHDENDDFTFFMSFKHTTGFKSIYYVAFENDAGFNLFPSPYIYVTSDQFAINKYSNVKTTSTITSAYDDEYLMIWWCKTGTTYQVQLCDNGSRITETINNPRSFQVINCT